MTGTSGAAPTPTRADGEQVRFDPAPLTIDRAEPGDLVFVRSDPTPLGTVISELDGCAFSHVGVLARDDEPTLLSARTDRHPSLHAPDLGGIRRDRLSALVGRGLCVAPLRLAPEVRSAGLARLEGWVDVVGPDVSWDSRSRFSFAKLVAASAALAAVRRRHALGEDDARDLWDAAVAAAEALRWRREVPGFYCAEAVAVAYDLEFTYDALWVRDGEPHPVGVPPHRPVAPPVPAAVAATGAPAAEVPPAGDDGVIDLRHLRDVGDDLREALHEIGLTTAQTTAVVDLLATLGRHDWRLGWRLLQAGWQLAGRGHQEPPPLDPPPAGPFVPPPFVGGVGTILPTALVTPRLLLSETVVRSVHHLAL